MARKVTGMMFYYNEVCQRKLWYFSHEIVLENDDENVQLGRLIDTNYSRQEDKHITINDTISIDFINNEHLICEVKKSRKIEKASVWQLKYYLWYLKQYGLEGITGEIKYPTLKQTLPVELTNADELQIVQKIDCIEQILSSPFPPDKLRRAYCKKCAYYDFCMI